MSEEKQKFHLSGPVYLTTTTVDWTNPHHRRSVAASLVQSVYILERDRQNKREGSQALAPPWYKAFNFQLYRRLIDDADSCIFGAIYQLTSASPDAEAPRYVVAFRGTLPKGPSIKRDLILNFKIAINGQHHTSRFKMAIQAVRDVVATFGSSNVWIAGHSLGASLALLAGKNMAKSGVRLDAFLFNSPFLSAPIERIEYEKVKYVLRLAGSFITAGIAHAMKNNHQAHRTFADLPAWLPHLFVNPGDHICSEYVGYFEHRKRMEDIGAGAIERLATQHSIWGLVLNALDKQAEEPTHLIPSAHVTVNLAPARDFKESHCIYQRWKDFKKAHGIHQWWRNDLPLETKTFDAVIHLAGLKAVGESVQKPLMYYDNNLIGTIALLEVMATHGCKKLVFSSSATVYGNPKTVPCTEESPICAVNPYGRTKLFIEEICRDIYKSDSTWKIILLRYFNPVGAHPSGYIVEDPRGIPNNLMPFVQQVAVGRLPTPTVYANDYGTKDGTGVRDYIHVVDLAHGHIAALNKLSDPSVGCEVYNLGTGKGTSVLEMVAAFEKASGKKIPLTMAGRRPGDAEIVYASTEKAERELNWKAKYGIDEMCRDQWNWASKNPYGYEPSESSN